MTSLLNLMLHHVKIPLIWISVFFLPFCFLPSSLFVQRIVHQFFYWLKIEIVVVMFHVELMQFFLYGVVALKPYILSIEHPILLLLLIFQTTHPIQK